MKPLRALLLTGLLVALVVVYSLWDDGSTSRPPPSPAALAPQVAESTPAPLSPPINELPQVPAALAPPIKESAPAPQIEQSAPARAPLVPQEASPPSPPPPAAPYSAGVPAFSPADLADCPPGWSLLKTLPRKAPPGAEIDRLLLDAGHAGLTTNNSGVIIGGNGVLSFRGAPSYFNMDGQHVIGFGNLIVGGEGSVVNVLAPYLATVSTGEAKITGEPGLEVDLDGCLQWRKLEHSPAGDGYVRYAASDAEGSLAYVDVSKTARILALPPARIKAWAAALAKAPELKDGR